MGREKPKKPKRKRNAAPPPGPPGLLPGLGGPLLPPEPPKPASRQEIERVNRALSKLVAEREFADADELNAYLATLAGRSFDEILAQVEESPEEQAQELAYQAMEASSLREVQSLCRKALELDPHCIDALLIKAELNARSPMAYATRLRTIVREAEERFGADYMEENSGHFWGMVETRPYMRARQSLVLALEQSGQIEEAIAECEGMLELNPGDNQGIRDLLRGYYLQVGNVEGVRRLNKEYPETVCAICAWSMVLERWLSGKPKEAAKHARAAHKRNPHVAAYLSGKTKVPGEVPEFFSPGDINEAVGCAQLLGPGWKQHPEAIEWLEGLALS